MTARNSLSPLLTKSSNYYKMSRHYLDTLFPTLVVYTIVEYFVSLRDPSSQQTDALLDPADWPEKISMSSPVGEGGRGLPKFGA